MKRIIKGVQIRIKYALIDFIYPSKKYLKVFWYDSTHNFGDAITPILLGELSGKKVIRIDPNYYRKKHLLAIGSVLSMSHKNSIVWGAGFVSEKSECVEKPLKVYAVRGPKTRQKLIESGIDCHEVYGDPALLLPKIYYPKIKKKYKLGIVPHYVDKNASWLNNYRNMKDIKILDIQASDPFKFINDLLSCENIASSSLHGVIVGDAYHIPSIWITFSDKVTGGNFKFLDYFMSVGRKDTKALAIKKDTTLNDIFEQFYDYDININLDLLLGSCPFKIV